MPGWPAGDQGEMNCSRSRGTLPLYNTSRSTSANGSPAKAQKDRKTITQRHYRSCPDPGRGATQTAALPWVREGTAVPTKGNLPFLFTSLKTYWITLLLTLKINVTFLSHWNLPENISKNVKIFIVVLLRSTTLLIFMLCFLRNVCKHYE